MRWLAGVRSARRVIAAGLLLTLAAAPVAHAADRQPDRRTPPAAYQPSVVVRWNQALIEAVRRTAFRPMLTARALAIVHTAMFDAWAAYDDRAVGVHWETSLRQPRHLRSRARAEQAASMAAYRTLVDLFPSQTAALFDPLLISLGLDKTDQSFDLATPSGLGNRVAALVIAARHDDGANQLGNLSNGAPYSDYTGYTPVNTPDALVDPNRWQPLRAANGTVQVFITPHWRLVQPFALRSADQFRPGPPPMYPEPEYLAQVEAVRALSAGLTDRQKTIAEYWADGPNTETPPGHWNLFAQFVAQRDRHTFDEDIQMFFALGNALLDASIAVWDAKTAYDFIRPISAIRFVNAGRQIEAWAGPGLGTRVIPGEKWQSYIATPAFAEYTSGHSGFSAAAAAVLTAFTGSNRFGGAFTRPAGGSPIEPGLTPAAPITLSWRTFDEAAIEAGVSRRLGGIHYEISDLTSRRMGRAVGEQAWRNARRYIRGRGDRRDDDRDGDDRH
ncbi:MAG: vanadium-dependent haloperoxidase [Vicinamibacterales bacterium]